MYGNFLTGSWPISSQHFMETITWHGRTIIHCVSKCPRGTGLGWGIGLSLQGCCHWWGGGGLFIVVFLTTMSFQGASPAFFLLVWKKNIKKKQKDRTLLLKEKELVLFALQVELYNQSNLSDPRPLLVFNGNYAIENGGAVFVDDDSSATNIADTQITFLAGKYVPCFFRFFDYSNPKTPFQVRNDFCLTIPSGLGFSSVPQQLSTESPCTCNLHVERQR